MWAARVGKSSLTLKYCKDSFDEHQPSTVDASFLPKEVDIAGEKYTINLWDTAGQEKYHALN
jgi:small GTP-binding protein